MRKSDGNTRTPLLLERQAIVDVDLDEALRHREEFTVCCRLGLATDLTKTSEVALIVATRWLETTQLRR